MTIQEFLRDFDIRYWRNSEGIGWLISNKLSGEARGFGFNTYTTDAEFKIYTGLELKEEAAESLWPFIQQQYNIQIENEQ
jgi:hypothetical protein